MTAYLAVLNIVLLQAYDPAGGVLLLEGQDIFDALAGPRHFVPDERPVQPAGKRLQAQRHSLQNHWGHPVLRLVLLQAYDPAGGVLLLEGQDIFDGGPAEAVDGPTSWKSPASATAYPTKSLGASGSSTGRRSRI